ncbi:DUF6153 family protein [Leifsonia sp. PS1209]|uniref:DUF6153 family protein n=1 Tax=Leifsonia sp. PS1209 TaxID=2724914 RepID=UPI001442CD38|nr:DUF6153 family protein [Leifsonia sp. PS1209]QIZ99881.1 hypothetical protein HF024_16140 [Leifsonia sp. PS1209]
MLADGISMNTRTWRRLFILLIAVAGIVTGLLAMHVVSTPVSQSHEFAASHVAAGVADQAPSHGTAADPWALPAAMSATGTTSACAAGGCDPMHDMTVMVCTLALLAATILLLAPALARALLGAGTRAAPSTLIRTAARTIGWSPPSFLALSVDRR